MKQEVDVFLIKAQCLCSHIQFQYIVTFARHTDGRENHAGMIITYEVPRKKYFDKQRMTRSMTKPPSTVPKFNQISIHDEMPINIARFGHLPWQGTVIGTCSGKLYLMRVGPRQISVDTGEGT